MGMRAAAEKVVKELVRVLGVYRRKDEQQVRTEQQKSEGSWQCRMPIAWTWDIHRVCDGRVQIGLVLRIFAHSLGAPHRESRPVSEWTPGLIAEDWAKELNVDPQTVRNAIDDGIARGIFERRSEDPKAKQRAYYQLRLCPEIWPSIPDPITPKKLPTSALDATQRKQPKDPAGIERVRPGVKVNFAAGTRYEFEEVKPAAIENEMTEGGTMVLDSAGLLRIVPAKAKAAVVEMPEKSEPVENTETPKESHPSPRGRNSKLTPNRIPLTLVAVKETELYHNANFFRVLLKATYTAVEESGGDVALVTDELLARAIPECQFAKQESCGGFVTSVPGWIATHLHDKPMPAPATCGTCGRLAGIKGSRGCKCRISRPAVTEPAEPELSPLELYRRNRDALKSKAKE